MANGFIWYALITTGTEAAKAFYRAVVGRETEDLGGPAADPQGATFPLVSETL